MAIIRKRYREIKDFIEGLHMAGLLENKKSTLLFLNGGDHWSSQLTIRENGKIDVFSVYYMKEKDEVWVKSNLNSLSNNEINMHVNNITYDVKKTYNLTMGEVEIFNTFTSKKALFSFKIEPYHGYDLIYEIYKLFRAYQTGTTYKLKSLESISQ